MSDEVASATLSSSQKAIEVTLELIKMLAPLVKQFLSEVYYKSVDGINAVGGIISNAKAAGTISNKGLVAAAQKAGSPITTTSNFLARDAQRLAEKAKEYKIPVAVVGHGEKVTVEFLDRDKGIVEQITNELMAERLKENPQSVKCFSVGENSVSSLKAMFEENGIECQFLQSTDGKVKCVYPAENAEQVAIIKDDYKAIYSQVDKNCKITPNIPESERMTEIKAQIDELRNAEVGSYTRSEVYNSLLSDMRNKGVEFPVYSENNNKIIEREMPYATQTAGKAFWEQQGFKLNENAKGIEIVAPQMDENGNPVLDDNGKQAFSSVTVYDISETNAYEQSISARIDTLQKEYNTEKAAAFSQADNKSVVVSDEQNQKTVEFTVLDSTRKEDVVRRFRNELGYSEAQADIAANKLCYELGLNKEKYFAKPSQLDNLNALQTNIRYQSDDLTIRDIRYDAVYFKNGADPHILLQNGEKAVGLTPAKMSHDEMLSICKNQLGLTDNQSQLAIAKAEKIESQMRSKVEERTIDDKGLSLEMHIERTANNTFTISLGDKSQSYNFSDENAAEKLSKDFGVPLENAKNAVSKAQKQSVIQNKIRNAANKKNAPAPEKPKLSESKVKKH